MTRADADTADYARADVLYAGTVPTDLVSGDGGSRAPRLKWLQLHMAGVDAFHTHPVYTKARSSSRPRAGCTRR